MFCINCGNNIKDGAKFCPKCGTPVAPKKKASQSVLMIALIIGAVLLLCLFVVLFIVKSNRFNNNGDEITVEESNTDSDNDNLADSDSSVESDTDISNLKDEAALDNDSTTNDAIDEHENDDIDEENSESSTETTSENYVEDDNSAFPYHIMDDMNESFYTGAEDQIYKMAHEKTDKLTWFMFCLLDDYERFADYDPDNSMYYINLWRDREDINTLKAVMALSTVQPWDLGISPYYDEEDEWIELYTIPENIYKEAGMYLFGKTEPVKTSDLPYSYGYIGLSTEYQSNSQPTKMVYLTDIENDLVKKAEEAHWGVGNFENFMIIEQDVFLGYWGVADTSAANYHVEYYYYPSTDMNYYIYAIGIKTIDD